MSILAAKYTKDKGWVLAKNRDLTFKPIVRIRKSFRQGVERLYIWDDKTKYTEGINEFGVCVANVPTDSEEINRGKYGTKPISLDGIKLRKILFQSTVETALQEAINLQITGNTIICDTTQLYILEGKFLGGQYFHVTKNVSHNETVVRTNLHHLIDNGEERNLEDDTCSSYREKILTQELLLSIKASDVLDAISCCDHENAKFNPLCNSTTRGQLRTTGQILLIPSERTLHYRPIWGEIRYNMEKLNQQMEKTFFEIVSTKKLITFKESFIGEKNHENF